MTTKRQKWDRKGLQCIQADAIDQDYDKPTPRTGETDSSVAVVEIFGPLDHHCSGWFLSYDEIRCCMQEAFDSDAQTVVMRIDSPGGDASGCFELSRWIRKTADDSGKTVIAFADELAASAAYSIACAADWICTPSSGTVGSVGVISVLADCTKMDSKLGVKFAVITSGERKADGNPHVELSDDAIAEVQSHVDDLAQQFFELVAEHRGVSADKVKGLQAATFTGQAAIDAGLADEIASLDQVLAHAASEQLTGEHTMKTKAQLIVERDRKLAAAVSVDAKKKIEETYKKKIEEEDAEEEAEDDAEEEESEDEESKRCDDDAEDDADDAEDADEGEDEEDEEDDDEEDDKKKVPAKKSKKAHSAAVRRLLAETGAKSLAQLTGMVQASKSNSDRLRKLELENRKSKVAGLVKQGMRDGKIIPAQKAYWTQQGMKSIEMLKGYLATAVPVSTEYQAPSSIKERALNGQDLAQAETIARNMMLTPAMKEQFDAALAGKAVK